MSVNPSPIPLTDPERRRQNVFKFFSPLCQRIVDVESFVEYLVWLSLEFCQDVIFLCERPCKLEGVVDGRKQPYRPDLFVRAKNENGIDEHLGETKKVEELIEFEPGVWLPERWPTMNALCQQAHHTLRLYTDGDFVEQRIAVENWREALPYVADEAQRPRPELRQQVIEQFGGVTQLALGEVSSGISDWDTSEAESAALWWVHQGRLALDWNDRPLGRDTLLTIVPEESDWRRA